MNSLKKQKHSILPTALATTLLVAALPSQAATCAGISNVVTSTQSDQKNRNAGGKGGHVGLHMKDASSPLPPSGANSQLDKSAFKNWAAFKGAFDTWKANTTKPHANCGTSGGPKDIVDASLVNITEAWKCTAAGANGICSNWQKIKPTKVCFIYYNNTGSSGTAGKWLMNTAYPSVNADCT